MESDRTIHLCSNYPLSSSLPGWNITCWASFFLKDHDIPFPGELEKMPYRTTENSLFFFLEIGSVVLVQSSWKPNHKTHKKTGERISKYWCKQEGTSTVVQRSKRLSYFVAAKGSQAMCAHYQLPLLSQGNRQHLSHPLLLNMNLSPWHHCDSKNTQQKKNKSDVGRAAPRLVQLSSFQMTN